MLKLAEGLWHGVINFFTNKLWHDGVETVTQMVGGVLKWIEKLVTDGLKFFGDLKTRALNLIMSWVILMVAHAEHLVGQIGEKLGQLPGKVLGLLGDLKTKAVDGLGTVATSALTAAAGIGKSIVDGITSGLRNAWHTITSTLSGLASNLPGPIKSALGISSPSKVFAHHIGGPIAHGIAHGITQHAHHVGLAAHNAALHGLHQARQAANSAMQHHRPAHHGGFKKGHVPWNKGKHPGTTHTSGGGSLSGGESAAQEKAETQLADKTYQVLVHMSETLDSILKVEESNGGSPTNGAHSGHKEISGQTQQTLDTLGWAMIERAQYARTRGLQGEILAP